MSLQTKKCWTELLKPALILMNSTKKKSIGCTPYMVMFGRESRFEDLLSTIEDITSTPQEDFEFEEAIFAEFTMDSNEIEDVFLPSLTQEVEETSHQDRTKVYKSSADSIRSDQLRQRRQFDKKVNETRCVLEIYLFN